MKKQLHLSPLRDSLGHGNYYNTSLVLFLALEITANAQSPIGDLNYSLLCLSELCFSSIILAYFRYLNRIE